MNYTILCLSILVLYVASTGAQPATYGMPIPAVAPAARAGVGKAVGATTCNPQNCVCHGELGCFRKRHACMENSAPLPESPTALNTRFLLHKRGSRTGTALTNKMTGSALFAAGFDSRRKTIIPIHGWTQSTTAFDGLKNVLLKKGDYNVILVDWEKGAGITRRWPLAYTQPVQNTRVVGKQLAMLISHLQTTTSLNINNVHIIGASLGAHVAGYTGMYLNGTVGRITGLDPSKPNFEGQPAECKLESTDSQFVDVIHTNMDVAGVAESIGHVDFFPNGGRQQPGCSSPICSHLRAKSYYRASVWTDCQFRTTRCDGKPCGRRGCPAMGFAAFKPNDLTAVRKGEYCLTTIERPPYCTDVKDNTPKYPGKTNPGAGLPLPPNTGNGVGNPGKPPRVFSNNPGSNTGWANQAGTAGANHGNRAAQSGGSNIGGAANKLEGNANGGVRHHTTFATGLSLFLALFLALVL